MLSDFRHAFRSLSKSPGFCAIAILTLALAIGVNSAVFSLIDSIVLRPVVPLRPDEVVNIFTARKDGARDYRQFSHAEFQALRANKDVFADVAAVNFALAGIGSDTGIRRSFAFFVSDNFFALMGVTPIAGRFFTADESRPNSMQPVVIASYSLWRRMGGKPAFVGSTLRVNGRPYTVVGVTPEGFSGLNALIAPDLWLPLGMFSEFARVVSEATAVLDLASPRNYTLNLTARLRPGLTLATAQPLLPVLAQRLTAMQPPDATGARELQIQHPSRYSLTTSPTNDSSLTALSAIMLGMAGCVLLVASLNLANMLLARGTDRSHEIAIRLALGATRWRVIRQLVAEGLLLSLAGGAAGVLLSVWANDLFLDSLGSLFTSMNFSLVMRSRPDLLVLGVTLGLSIAATLIFSLGPALKSSRVDLATDLKQAAGTSALTGRFSRFFAPRHCLVMAQIALSLMLLFSAGLFLRGALRAGGVDLGFKPQGDLVAEMDFSLGSTTESNARAAIAAAVDRVRQLPGVSAVSVGTLLPYGPVSNTARVVPAAIRLGAPAETIQKAGADPLLTSITTDYFRAIEVKLLQGRDFTVNEVRDKAAPRVAIIDEALARKLFPRGNAVGQRIRYTQPPADGSPAEMEIVGVCGSHRNGVLEREAPPRLFVPLAQSYNANVFLHARLANSTPAASRAAIAPLRSALLAADSDLPILQITPYPRLVEKNIGLWLVRLGAVLFGLFGAIALVLAVVGVYGVKAYAVARRTREIGIRMALGADARNVFALVMKQGVLQTALAVVLGSLLALGVGQLLSHLLYQVSPRDPLVLGVAAGLLCGAALAACFFPARRAARIEPMTALRSE